MTLYLKYRPQKLDELDLADVRESLGRIVKSGKIPHAFLFAGPKGTGKTSAARILAKIVNCETNQPRRNASLGGPCNKCEQCLSIMKGNNLDVIELDAASHRGIDDVRALREAVKLAPARARKKVYIIDEAHMLTLEASNALLKTLEEPPEHVIFILATTNPEKLIETIRSRTTIVLFNKATAEEVTHSLERVVGGEKIKIKKEALMEIARASEGSFRDAAKILEQMTLEKKPLDVISITEYLFQKKTFNVDSFLELIAKRDTKAALADIEKVMEKGGSIEILIDTILRKLRLGLLAKVGAEGEDLKNFNKEELVYLIELFSKASREIADSPIEELPVEIAVIEWCSQGKKLEVGSEKVDDEVRGSRIEDRKEKAKSQTSSVKPPTSNLNEEVWRKILATVKPINTTIEALLRAAKPVGYDGKNLTLGVFYRFHKERLEDGHNRRILEEVVAEILGNSVRVICTLTEPPPKKAVEETKEEPALTESEDKDIIKIAEEIFGS